MLADEELFHSLECFLVENGSIAKFEKEFGPVESRMMITLTDAPDGIEVKPSDSEQGYAFEATFDSVDCAADCVVYPVSRTLGSGLWLTPQTERNEKLCREGIEFFINTLLDNIKPDGSIGVPMYTIFNGNGNLTVVPIAPDEYYSQKNT